jgi:predicted nicotinamide N-methyase
VSDIRESEVGSREWGLQCRATPPSPLPTPALRGDALVSDLERRFVTVVEPVAVGAMDLQLIRPRSAEELISEADFDRDERLPYWAEVWPSSLVLAARLAREHGCGRRLLELGCGLGVVALAAMRAGFDVLATDYYEDALRFTRANAWRALGREPRTRLLDWRDLPADLGSHDAVVAADVLYERPYAALVARAIAHALAPGGEAFIADPGRVAASDFPAQCATRGLAVCATEVHPHSAREIRQRITIYIVRRAP